MVKLFQYTNCIDYDETVNKPEINGVTVEGKKTLNDYGIQGKLEAGKNIKIKGNEISAEYTEATFNYNYTYNKPAINGVELINNVPLEVMDIQKSIKAGQHVYLTKSNEKKMDDTVNVYETTENRKGVIQIATQQEVTDGANDDKAVTPKKLKEIVDGLLNKIKGLEDIIYEYCNDITEPDENGIMTLKKQQYGIEITEPTDKGVIQILKNENISVMFSNPTKDGVMTVEETQRQ